MSSTIFEVHRSDFARSRLVPREESPLANGAVRLGVDRFAFTANNMTYALAGDMLGYWKFFPGSEEGWGVIPVWAIASVLESNHDDVAVGEQLYGYFPPAQTYDMLPVKVSGHSMVDGTEHRQVLPPLYNRYTRLKAPLANAEANARVLLAPLHMTSFCLYDALKQKDWRGSQQVLIASASSKTSLGLAYGLAHDEAAPPVVGFTSPSNVEFVRSTGLYDLVLAYDALDDLASKPSVLVDMAGNRSLVAALYQRLGDQLLYRINVGATHWQDSASAGSSELKPGSSDNSEMFFAPSYILERMKEMQPGEWDRLSGAFMAGAAKATFGWMSVDERAGLEGLEQAYPSFVDGSWPADKGLVVLP